MAVVHRSDGSGTTFIFANHLAKVSPESKDKVGENTAVEWPTGLGGKGNEAVAASVSRTDGAIGPAEHAHAWQHKFYYSLLANRAGFCNQPDAKPFQAAPAKPNWKAAPGYDL